MAEFCLDCFVKMDETFRRKEDLVISRDLDLCEGCGEMKHAVVRYKIRYSKRKTARHPARVIKCKKSSDAMYGVTAFLLT